VEKGSKGGGGGVCGGTGGGEGTAKGGRAEIQVIWGGGLTRSLKVWGERANGSILVGRLQRVCPDFRAPWFTLCSIVLYLYGNNSDRHP